MTEPAIKTERFFGRATRLRPGSSCPNRYQNLGQVGKKNQKRILDRHQARSAAIGFQLLVSLLAGGCKADLAEPLQSGQVLALSGLQGRWVGQVVPAETTCGQPTQGLMSIGEKGFGFDPFGSTTVIHGQVDHDGHLSGSFSQGSEARGLSITFQGAAEGSDAIRGTLVSGRCHWSVTLHRG